MFSRAFGKDDHGPTNILRRLSGNKAAMSQFCVQTRSAADVVNHKSVRNQKAQKTMRKKTSLPLQPIKRGDRKVWQHRYIAAYFPLHVEMQITMGDDVLEDRITLESDGDERVTAKGHTARASGTALVIELSKRADSVHVVRTDGKMDCDYAGILNHGRIDCVDSVQERLQQALVPVMRHFFSSWSISDLPTKPVEKSKARLSEHLERIQTQMRQCGRAMAMAKCGENGQKMELWKLMSTGWKKTCDFSELHWLSPVHALCKIHNDLQSRECKLPVSKQHCSSCRLKAAVDCVTKTKKDILCAENRIAAIQESVKQAVDGVMGDMNAASDIEHSFKACWTKMGHLVGIKSDDLHKALGDLRKELRRGAVTLLVREATDDNPYLHLQRLLMRASVVPNLLAQLKCAIDGTVKPMMLCRLHWDTVWPLFYAENKARELDRFLENRSVFKKRVLGSNKPTACPTCKNSIARLPFRMHGCYNCGFEGEDRCPACKAGMKNYPADSPCYNTKTIVSKVPRAFKKREWTERVTTTDEFGEEREETVVRRQSSPGEGYDEVASVVTCGFDHARSSGYTKTETCEHCGKYRGSVEPRDACPHCRKGGCRTDVEHISRCRHCDQETYVEQVIPIYMCATCNKEVFGKCLDAVIYDAAELCRNPVCKRDALVVHSDSSIVCRECGMVQFESTPITIGTDTRTFDDDEEDRSISAFCNPLRGMDTVLVGRDDAKLRTLKQTKAIQNSMLVHADTRIGKRMGAHTRYDHLTRVDSVLDFIEDKRWISKLGRISIERRIEDYRINFSNLQLADLLIGMINGAIGEQCCRLHQAAMPLTLYLK